MNKEETEILAGLVNITHVEDYLIAMQLIQEKAAEAFDLTIGSHEAYLIAKSAMQSKAKLDAIARRKHKNY